MNPLRISAQDLDLKDPTPTYNDDKENVMENHKSPSHNKENAIKKSNPKFNRTPDSTSKTKKEFIDLSVKSKEPLLDEDVNNFTKRLELMLTHFKTESVSDFIAFKKQILNDQTTKIEKERKNADTLVSQKHKELTMIKEQMEETRRCNAKLESMNDAISLQLMRNHQNKEMVKIRAACFCKWLYKTRMVESNKKIMNKIIKIKALEFKRNTFVEWKKFYIDNKKTKAMENVNNQLKQQSEKLNTEYAHEIQSLRNQLQEAKKQIEQELLAKQLIQENLKKAFMRGICAMNYEASTIINDPTEPNPTPMQEDISPPVTKEVTVSKETSIQTKDNKWLPAPVIGAEIPRTIIPQPLKSISKLVTSTGIDGRSEKLFSVPQNEAKIEEDIQMEKIKLQTVCPTEEGKVIRVNKKGLSYIDTKKKYNK
jgi:hypothetical protein